MALSAWALPRLGRLLSLDEESLKQVISYTDTLSKSAAAEHLKNLLGDSPPALEFITSFNTRRPTPPAEAAIPTSSGPSRDVSDAEVPRAGARPRKKKTPFNRLPPPRRPEDAGNITGAYIKRDEDDYMAGRLRKDPPLANTLALQEEPDARQLPTPSNPISQRTQHSRLPPSAAGSLISDETPSRSSSPAPNKAKTKISVAGGTSMRGQSATINDLDSAIRVLEMQTNPGLASKQDDARRRCNCMGQRHALLAAAPNCMNCGKIVCAKEGLGPCTFCEKPLLSSSDIQAMVKVLREERGREKMEVNNASHKRAEVAKAPKAFATLTTPASSAQSSDSEPEKLSAAKQHRDRLLKFQADNARRTRIHDEAADFETPDAGQSLWATPQERALQLKRQQQVLREQEWNARPEYEKRKMVVSIDVVGGKAVRKMANVERKQEVESEDDDSFVAERPAVLAGGGTFSRNPLLGSLIRPVYKADDKGKAVDAERRTTWRRVQDDNEDNEQWILDGGAYGGHGSGRPLGEEERAHG